MTGGYDTYIPFVVQVQYRHTLGIPLGQKTCIAAASDEKQPSPRPAYKNTKIEVLRRRGVVGRIRTFQFGGHGLIPGGLGVCPFSVMSCVVPGGEPDIVLTAHSKRLAIA